MQHLLRLESTRFNYAILGFNVLFLSYVLAVGYYNRLSLDDFAYMGILRDYGFANPFTYWYTNWQGRFAPQFFLNAMFEFYHLTANLVFYPILISSIFIYSFYQILSFSFRAPKFILFNYSILLFSAFLLTTFELSTFYWINASVMYFGGVAFLLLGIVFIIRKGKSILTYLIIAMCCVYTGCSSENFGVLAFLILFSCLAFWFLVTAYRFDNAADHLKYFRSHGRTRKLVWALLFCATAFVLMIMSPGTAVRMAQGQHSVDPFHLLYLSADSTWVVYLHIFYKAPYILAFIPLFVFFGCKFRFESARKVKFRYSFLIASVVFFLIIFISNVPLSYALGQVGPLRSYVFVSFLLIVMLFALCVHLGARHHQILSTPVPYLLNPSIILLFVFVGYTFYCELPLLMQYSQTDKHRIQILTSYRNANRTEPVFVPPIFNPEYLTITDVWRRITKTDHLRAYMTDMPVMIGEISESTHWRNGHLKHGLNLKFDVYLAPRKK